MLEEEDIALFGDPFLFVMGKHLLCHRILQNKTIVELKYLGICEVDLDTNREKNIQTSKTWTDK